jgi:hypothetical protein
MDARALSVGRVKLSGTVTESTAIGRLPDRSKFQDPGTVG